MIVTQAKFTVEYTVDLDGVPGWGYEVEDWIKLAKREIELQGHYNTSAQLVGTPTFRPVCHSNHELCNEVLK